MNESESRRALAPLLLRALDKASSSPGFFSFRTLTERNPLDYAVGTSVSAKPPSLTYCGNWSSNLRSGTRSFELLVEGFVDVAGDHVAIFFKREVTGVEEVELQVL
jgi:hypothetical protein